MEDRVTHTKTMSPRAAGELIKKALGVPPHAVVGFRVEIVYDCPMDRGSSECTKVTVTWDEKD